MPSEETDATTQIVEQACAAGLKRGQSFFGDHEQLQQHREELLAMDHKEDTSQTDEMLIFVRPLPLDIAHIEAAKVEMQLLGTKHAVTFDGWSVCAR